MHPAGAVFITILTIFRVTRAGEQITDWATSQGYAGTQATRGIRISVYDVIDAVGRAGHTNRQWLAQRSPCVTSLLCSSLCASTHHELLATRGQKRKQEETPGKWYLV